MPVKKLAIVISIFLVSGCTVIKNESPYTLNELFAARETDGWITYHFNDRHVNLLSHPLFPGQATTVCFFGQLMSTSRGISDGVLYLCYVFNGQDGETYRTEGKYDLFDFDFFVSVGRGLENIGKDIMKVPVR